MKKDHDPIIDPEVQRSLFSILSSCQASDVDWQFWDNNFWYDQVEEWMLSSPHHSVIGLDQFCARAYCAGVHDALQAFVMRHGRTRRIRFSRAEYVGGRINASAMGADWKFLEEDDIQSTDAVIISFPWAGNGHILPAQDYVLERCEKIGVPVFLDMAYFGISRGLTFDLAYPCIREAAISFSKPISPMLRLGMRWTKDDFDDSIQSLGNFKLYNRLAVKIGISLLQNFSHDWLVRKYETKQQEVCKNLAVQGTPTLTLAMGTPHLHDNFDRFGYLRICITEELLNA